MIKKEKMHWSIITILLLILLATPNISAQSLENLEQRGWQAMERGDYQEALNYFEKALTIDPAFRPAVEGKLEALMNLGRMNRAKKFVDSYVEKYKRNPIAWAWKGVVYDRAGDHGVAEESFDRAIRTARKFTEAEPDNFEAWETLGDVLSMKGDFTGAIKAYRKALSIEPDAEHLKFRIQEMSQLSEEEFQMEEERPPVMDEEFQMEEERPPVMDEETPYEEIPEESSARPRDTGGKLGFLALLNWEAIGVILVVLGAIGGWFMTKRRKGRIRKLLDDVDTAYSTFKMKSRRCEAELYRLKDVISDEFKDGKIDEQSFSLLDKRIDDYLAEVREQIMNEKFGGLPSHLRDEMHKMLEDGEISGVDVSAFDRLLKKATGISESEKDDLMKTMKKWEKKDR